MIAIIASEIISVNRLKRLPVFVTKYPVTIKNRAISKPPRLITASKRCTIIPASSFAFANCAPRKTPNTVGATAAPKNTAAPSQRPSSKTRKYRMNAVNGIPSSLFNRSYFRQQADCGRVQFGLLDLPRIRNSQEPGERAIELRLVLSQIERHEYRLIQARKFFFGHQ